MNSPLKHKPTQVLAVGLIMTALAFFSFSKVYTQGFKSVTELTSIASAKNTGEKPQSKVWKYAGNWWAVFPVSDGSFIWRLDDNNWTKVLKISSSRTVKADCKAVDNVVHILLWRKPGNPSQLISVEYIPSSQSYQHWTERPTTSFIDLDPGTETGTIDIDSQGRMWLASDGVNEINVRWSDYPYDSWSQPITLESGVTDDDIAAIIAFPSLQSIGIFWSNQQTQRFGFKIHRDADPPQFWSTDEVPASQSALDIRDGMSDDHLNLVASSDGTLFCAVKTGFDKPGYPTIALLKRHPDGNWDDLYEVTSDYGTRGIVILNESIGKLKVVYSYMDHGGDILYKESRSDIINFGDEFRLLQGTYDNATSSKSNYTPDVVILASNNTSIVGVLAEDMQSTVAPQPPSLLSPDNQTREVETNPTLRWTESPSALFYRLQVSTTNDFNDILLYADSIDNLEYGLSALLVDTAYFWRVQAFNIAGTSEWSEVWSFSTVSMPPAIPFLLSPADSAIDVVTDPLLQWSTSSGAELYNIQLSLTEDFQFPNVDEAIADSSFQVSNLQKNMTYHWRVRAVNQAGNSGWTSSWSFKTLGNSLLGYWRMDDNGPVLVDASGNNNNGLIFGNPELSQGIIDNAIKFNGIDQLAVVEDNSSLSASRAITLAAWIRPEKLSSQRIIEKGSRESTGGYELTLLSTGKVSFRFNETLSEAFKVNSRTLYPTDGQTWMHIVATFDGTSARMYINGVLDKTATFAPPQQIQDNKMPLTIGGRIDFNSLFQGTLDEVRIYNYALSESEIQSLTTTTDTVTHARLVTGNSEDNISQNSSIIAYPNPAQDIVNIAYNANESANISLQIADMQGRVINCNPHHQGPGKLFINLDELNLHNSLYLLIIRTKNDLNIIKLIKH